MSRPLSRLVTFVQWLVRLVLSLFGHERKERMATAQHLPGYEVFTFDYDADAVAGEFVTVTFHDDDGGVSSTYQHNSGTIAAHLKGPFPKTDEVTIEGDSDTAPVELEVTFDF